MTENTTMPLVAELLDRFAGAATSATTTAWTNFLDTALMVAATPRDWMSAWSVFERRDGHNPLLLHVEGTREYLTAVISDGARFHAPDGEEYLVLSGAVTDIADPFSGITVGSQVIAMCLSDEPGVAFLHHAPVQAGDARSLPETDRSKEN